MLLVLIDAARCSRAWVRSTVRALFVMRYLLTINLDVVSQGPPIESSSASNFLCRSGRRRTDARSPTSPRSRSRCLRYPESYTSPLHLMCTVVEPSSQASAMNKRERDWYSLVRFPAGHAGIWPSLRGKRIEYVCTPEMFCSQTPGGPPEQNTPLR